MRLRFNNISFLREPYPIGLAKQAVEPALYAELAAAFPPPYLFAHMGGAYHKYSLSEVNHPEQYRAFLSCCPPWKAFFLYVKSPLFLADVFAALGANGVKAPAGKFRSRFEFSALPADGGYLRPHTDIPSKVLTLVLGLDAPGDWDPAWGGGTDVLRPKVCAKVFRDYQSPLADFDVVQTFAHEPNECVVFVKTDNSWHSVGPLTGPAGVLRRTATINIERAEA